MSFKKSGTFFGSLTLLLFTIFLTTTFSPRGAYASPGDIHTFAGFGTAGFAGDGGTATAALINAPNCVAVDTAGNLYITDRANQRIRKVGVSGNISTIAGTGVAGYLGDGGPALAARLNTPSGIAVDARGNVFFADKGNNRIRKIDPSGVITTVAGTGEAGFTGDGGPAVSAAINHPEGVTVDSVGNLYISDSGNSRIRKVAVTGIINTIAGIGVAGYLGDGGPASAARLNRPAGIALGAGGRLYIADCYNQRVRVIDAAGVITTLAGKGVYSYSGDGGPAVNATLRYPTGVSADAAGNVYISDWYNHRVRVVDASGTINTLAGTGLVGSSGDGGPASAAKLYYPFGVASDASGNVFIADSRNNRIRMVEGLAYPLPVSVITWPLSGLKLYSGNPGITITGTASAARGISFVEVSTDGGATWETAKGAGTWSYVWKPQANGAYLIMSRAADSRGAHETIIDCVKVNVVLDPAPPVSKITSPAAGAVLALPVVTVAGYAADGTGSGVAGVEISMDGGKTWQQASGTTRWSYKWTLPPNGAYTIMTRATDRAGNVEAPLPAMGVTVQVPVTVATLASDKASAMPYQSVTWTAASYGGDQNYQYQFMRKGPDTAGAYVVAQDWGKSNKWTWDVARSSVGANTVMVNVVDGTVAVSGTVGATGAGGTPTSPNGKGSKSKGITILPVTAITISSLSPSPTSATAGTSVTWTASATGGTGNYLYQFMRMGPDTGGVYVVAQDWSASKTWSWATSLAMAGANTVKVNVENFDGLGLVTKTSSAYTVSYPAIVINSLTPDVASPGSTGTPVTWTASATGGSGSYQYQFSRLGPGTGGVYAVTQAWGTARTWTWTPTDAMAGSNTVMVSVRNVGGTAAVTKSAAYTVNQVFTAIAVGSITPSIASPATAGTAVTWTVSATGGSGSYQYQFSRTGPDTGGNAVVAQAWGTSKTWSWTPTNAMVGSNTITVGVRNSDGTGAVSSTAPAYTVNYPAIAINSLASDVASPATAGTSVTWTASATGGSGTYQYQFTRTGPDTGGSAVVAQAWGASKTWTWATAAAMAGSNTVTVSVRNSDGSGTVTKSATFSVSQAAGAIVIGSITPSIASPATAGTSVTWTASATGGTGSYQYQFSRTGPDTGGASVVTQAWGTSRTWSWTPTNAMVGSNTITVSVRNSDGTGTVTSAAPAYSVNYPPVAVGSLSPNPASATAGTSVTWTATATGGTGSYQYQFTRQGPDTGGSAVVVQAWGASNTWAWATTSAMAGSNTITVSVRNSDGTGAVSKTAAFTLSLASGGSSHQVSLTWTPSTSTAVAGYKIYFGTVSGQYTQSVAAGNVTAYTVSNLASGTTYYFALTSYDSYGNESAYSNEVSASIP